jgi:hypothetical protein
MRGGKIKELCGGKARQLVQISTTKEVVTAQTYICSAILPVN